MPARRLPRSDIPEANADFLDHPLNFAGAMEDLSSYTGWQKASVHERTARADTSENRGEVNNSSGLVCKLPRCRSAAR